MVELDKSTGLQSVQNGLKIIKLFTDEKPVLGVTDISIKLQLHKSTVSRLVKELVEEGFLEKTKTKYRLGYSLLTLSGIIVSQLEIHREAKDSLKALVEKTKETAHISILEGTTITYLDKIECNQPVRLLSRIGKMNPASCTSSGKVLLAFGSIDKVNHILSEGLPKMGPNSVTDKSSFLEQLTEIKQTGYAVCIDEMHEDVVSIGAPIRDFSGEVIAAINIAGPKDRIQNGDVSSFIKEVVKAGEDISLKLGYRL